MTDATRALAWGGMDQREMREATRTLGWHLYQR